MKKLRVLSLFSGIGGFELGLERTGGFKTVAQCEISPHARGVLAKNFPGVPCHDDVTTYEFREGEADVIAAGFPCQDISFAGAGAGLAGARSGLYREVIRAVRMVRPLYALLENVAALLSRGLGTVLGDLASIGYDTEWHCIPASAVGAPHRRDRVWIVAHARGKQHKGNCAPLSGQIAVGLHEGSMANAVGLGRSQQDDEVRSGWDSSLVGCENVADTEGERCNEARQLRCDEPKEWPARRSEEVANADIIDVQGIVKGVSDQKERTRSLKRPIGPCGNGFGWWSVEPDVGRVAHGVPSRVDRLAELGNAVVPQIPELIGNAILASLQDKQEAA